jgi:DNA-binding HxlR family transcriptional regulator
MPSEPNQKNKLDPELVAAFTRLSEEQCEALVQIIENIPDGAADRDYPSREFFALVGDKWSALILLVLQSGSLRHAQLRRIVSSVFVNDTISQFVLTQKLRAFERNGLVNRYATSDIPPAVSYELTPLGESFMTRIIDMFYWIDGHMDTIEQARKDFDSKE